MLSDYPDDLQLAWAYEQKALCLDAVGDVEAAVQAFHLAIDRERAFPNVRGNVEISFPIFVARRRLRSLFQEAISILDRPRDGIEFPAHRFSDAAARALMAADLGDHGTARQYAKLAMAAAAEGHSGLSRHPSVGLVAKENPLVGEIKKLMGPQR